VLTLVWGFKYGRHFPRGVSSPNQGESLRLSEVHLGRQVACHFHALNPRDVRRAYEELGLD
jgi:hypothetical protein